MKTKHTYLKVLSFLFLFSSSPVVFGDVLQDRPEEDVDPKMMEMILAFTLKDFKKVCDISIPLAQGVLQVYKEAVKWFNLSAEQVFASGQ